MLTREYNYLRKSQRVDVPLLIQVGTKVYKSSDWSMTGVGILGYEEEIHKGDILEGKLILMSSGASIHVDVVLVCRNIRDDIVGFELQNITDRHKRILRHYLELSLEGKIDNIEDLMSDFSAPLIESPIQEAISITAEEQVSLLKKFRSRAFLALTAGFLLMGYIIFTVVYNLVFVYETVGVTSTNLLQIKSGVRGTVKKTHVHEGDIVHAGDILFDLDEGRLLEELQVNSKKLAQQNRLLDNLEGEQPFSTGQKSLLVQLLNEEYLNKSEEYQRAQELFKQKIISIKDYEFVETSFRRARINYFRELETAQNKRELIQEKKNFQELQKDILLAEKESLLQNLEAMRVRAPVPGVVYTVDHFAGEFVLASDTVITLATDQKPFVLFKIPSRQSGKAKLGMPVKVYSFELDTDYEGKISSIGYSAINPRATLLQEVSLDQTVIKVDMPDIARKIPLNSRVRIWVKKESASVDRISEFFMNVFGKEHAEAIR